jgi:hypothetical protein
MGLHCPLDERITNGISRQQSSSGFQGSWCYKLAAEKSRSGAWRSCRERKQTPTLCHDPGVRVHRSRHDRVRVPLDRVHGEESIPLRRGFDRIRRVAGDSLRGIPAPRPELGPLGRPRVDCFSCDRERVSSSPRICDSSPVLCRNWLASFSSRRYPVFSRCSSRINVNRSAVRKAASPRSQIPPAIRSRTVESGRCVMATHWFKTRVPGHSR